MLKVIVVDDEQNAIKSLLWELENFCENIFVEASFTNANEAIEFLDFNDIDCVFLDIEMPEIDGFQFLDHFHKRDFEVVFVTAYDKYAINAIKDNALDYLLKPIDTDDLIKATDKIKNRKRLKKRNLENEETLNTITDKRIAIPSEGKLLFFNTDEIVYCESDGNYCKIFLKDGKSLYITKKLKEIYESLPKDIFCRVHNCYVVNIKMVSAFLKTDSILIMDNEKKIPVSRNKRASFLDIM